ncbi:uncharacterized protein [Physcomitrium patens]|uniref:Shikimate kinase n=1 Tax=Physcomitrium patens TaxID=3218 RepID=A9SQ82_PHYPA|nr:shikimate kinase 3, chloroplastic-like [Physcomitrium patens]XP_024377385.1 shikimate kinase 3, chloroplastic-like [Physcomitrium patens]PNR52983.1 hypothetical protein PHYPA_009358 [Physcomitrium patens]|eukprot:XP_024377384.1 shikimate kinase 3, chloroplastic-like [Physcomitrella patens]
MAALAIASVPTKCFVPARETAPRPCHLEVHQRFQLPAARLIFQRCCTLNAPRFSEKSFRKHFNYVTAAGSGQNLSTTNLSKDAQGEEPVAEEPSPDFDLLLKEKADELRDELQGTCIFLIGMMDNGKASVGKMLAKELGYYFFDSNDLVQQAADGEEISENEEGYREAETEVLKQLSSMGRLVVATGAGTVLNTENWGYLRHGIVVWIDIPVETVAKDAKTRQLLVPNSSDDEALSKLTKMYEERKEVYMNADATVSIQVLPAQLGIEDSSLVTPAMTALQVLNAIRLLVKEKQAKNLRF